MRLHSVLLLAGALAIGGVPALAQTAGTWAVTGGMRASEENAAASLMKDGRVLVAGGDQGGIGLVVKTAQIYDPATNAWTTVKNMASKRLGHSATTLPDGRILIAGGGYGAYPNYKVLKTIELFDPTTKQFSAGAPMATGRAGHTATMLPGGKVLVVGGMSAYYLSIRFAVCTNSVELYDPATANWSTRAPMSKPRCGHTTTVLPDGRILVAGGDFRSLANTAEIYDPATNAWTPTGNLNVARAGHSAALLNTGRVLVAGPDQSAELYDPASGSWIATGSESFTHAGIDIAVLPSGQVLAPGGNMTGASELYDPAVGLWSPTGSLNHLRLNFPVTTLANGDVLVSGGYYDWWTGEIYHH